MDIEAAIKTDIPRLVEQMLTEDLGGGDLTADLIAGTAIAQADIVTRESMTLSGRPWVDALFATLDERVSIDWRVGDGDTLRPGDVICRLSGPARSMLSGERAALNLLQTLSATATTTAEYVEAVAGTHCRILDTRKTLPGLRLAQKYAVRCGGGTNHRIGLYDAILIKENHIMASGGIAAAVSRAREQNATLPIEVEVESLDELGEALDAGADRVLLDNFSLEDLEQATRATAGRDAPALLEASGNVTLESVRRIAATGVDFISIGALTKNVMAVDLSMRFAMADDNIT